MRTWVMDNGELAVRLFYFDLCGGGFDAQSVVVGGVNNHISYLCPSVVYMRCDVM